MNALTLYEMKEFMSLLQSIIEYKKDQNLNKIWGKHKCYYVIEIKTFYNFTSLWFHSLCYLNSSSGYCST